MENNQISEKPPSLTLPHPVTPSPEASYLHLDGSWATVVLMEVVAKRRCYRDA